MELIPKLDPAARVAALTAGQEDLIPVIDPASAFSLKNNPAAALDIADGGTVMTMSMWADTAPFDDNRVRTAMKLVVDRQMLVDTAFFGFGEPGNDNPIFVTIVAASFETVETIELSLQLFCWFSKVLEQN